MHQLGMTNPGSNPGSEMELAASALGTLQQLGLDTGHQATSSQVAPGHTS